MAASSPALPADGAKIIDLIHSREAAGATYIAFEYFPPRTADGVTTLYKRFKRMATQRACEVLLASHRGARAELLPPPL